jgi:GNAT superfamily N-acetyltransferase
MQILEYDDVDPVSVLQLNTLALDFELTPEHVAHLRRCDPRLFSFFALYAVEEEQILGQVGAFHSPMVSREGREEVGVIWALCIHPNNARQEVASLLLNEVHLRMRAVDLRFSTVGINRNQIAYQFYQQHGYEDTRILATAIGRWETGHKPTRLKAQQAGACGYDHIENLFKDISRNYLGFAWRHVPFTPLHDKFNLGDIWILSENDYPIGYALAHANKSILYICNLLLDDSFDVIEAVAAIVTEVKTQYVKVKISRPVEITGMQFSGFRVTHPTEHAYMIKPLIPEINHEYAKDLFGIGTDRFLISCLDVS